MNLKAVLERNLGKALVDASLAGGTGLIKLAEMAALQMFLTKTEGEDAEYLRKTLTDLKQTGVLRKDSDLFSTSTERGEK